MNFCNWKDRKAVAADLRPIYLAPTADEAARSRAEAKIRCLKAFGERIAARDPDRQTAEINIRAALMNRFNTLDTAEIVCVAYNRLFEWMENASDEGPRPEAAGAEALFLRIGRNRPNPVGRRPDGTKAGVSMPRVVALSKWTGGVSLFRKRSNWERETSWPSGKTNARPG